MRKPKKPIDRLNDWEWTTLVGAWRYYENRGTIAASMFPDDIVNRFFKGAYSEDVQRMIAHQFAETDHGIRGEEDWIPDERGFGGGGGLPWLKFYRFCDGYCKGFHKVFLRYGKTEQEVEAFHVDYNDRWYPVQKYLEAPNFEQYCEPKYIKKIDGRPVVKAAAKAERKSRRSREPDLLEGVF